MLYLEAVEEVGMAWYGADKKTKGDDDDDGGI